ncbi:MAG: succinate dehydrogenase, cytochrome b556 subunit [Wolbachia endosymbiont of Meromenopon meropis]|nr:succinate dehydrogenase, cytochrome b556 subunit [Wolbachia endosymbiont of Meromenopon meropis]
MNNRPLSPHIQIYKVQVTSFFSFMHRLTGILLFFLLTVFSWYFVLRFYFPGSFIVRCLDILLSGFIAKLIYIICFISFLYHVLNGVRHLLWDAGFNLEITSASKSAVILTIILLFSTIVFLFTAI